MAFIKPGPSPARKKRCSFFAAPPTRTGARLGSRVAPKAFLENKGLPFQALCAPDGLAAQRGPSGQLGTTWELGENLSSPIPCPQSESAFFTSPLTESLAHQGLKGTGV